MEEVTACKIPWLSAGHCEANLDDCPKVIYSSWEGKQPLEHYVQGKEYLATVPKGFSCPLPSCLMSPWEVSYTKKMTLNLPPHSLPSTVWGTCQGCSALKFPLLGPEAPGTTNTSLHCLPASHFPVALMRQPCAHTIAYCGCLASHSLPHCRGLHTNNLLNLGPIEGDSSSHVQPVLLF